MCVTVMQQQQLMRACFTSDTHSSTIMIFSKNSHGIFVRLSSSAFWISVLSSSPLLFSASCARLMRTTIATFLTFCSCVSSDMAVHVHLGDFRFPVVLADDHARHTPEFLWEVQVLNICGCDITVTVNPNEVFMLLSSEKNVEVLLDFGLTRNQAKVYVAIARLRLASVGQISKASKVRREDVYRILPKLEKWD